MGDTRETMRRGVSLTSRCAGVLTALCLATTIGRAQEEASEPPVRARQRPWLDCWAITTRDSIPNYQRRYVVRLDTAWVTGREEDTLYRAWGLSGFRELPSWNVGWFPGKGPDSLRVVLIGLGGIGWRFGRSGDSLVGAAYEYYDVIPDETPLGPASAHRVECPR